MSLVALSPFVSFSHNEKCIWTHFEAFVLQMSSAVPLLHAITLSSLCWFAAQGLCIIHLNVIDWGIELHNWLISGVVKRNPHDHWNMSVPSMAKGWSIFSRQRSIPCTVGSHPSLCLTWATWHSSCHSALCIAKEMVVGWSRFLWSYASSAVAIEVSDVENKANFQGTVWEISIKNTRAGYTRHKCREFNIFNQFMKRGGPVSRPARCKKPQLHT